MVSAAQLLVGTTQHTGGFGAWEITNDLVGAVGYPIPLEPVVNEAGVTHTIAPTIPEGARITKAAVAVAIAAPGLVPIERVAVVRPGDGTEAASSTFVVDLGSLQTVTGIGPADLDNLTMIQAWEGIEFGSAALWPRHSVLPPPGVTTLAGVIRFGSEQLTSRLRLTYQAATSTAEVGTGLIELPAPPISAELRVNEIPVWFRQITPDLAVGGNALEERVDLTAAAQSALDGDGFVRIEIRTPTPAQLSLTPQIDMLRTHVVRFADGPDRDVVMSSEGEFAVDLPMVAVDGGSPTEDWDVTEVEMTVRGDPGPIRVRPAIGPDPLAPIAAGEPTPPLDLELRPERSLLVRLPAPLLTDYTVITGVRLPLVVDAAGLELTGTLLAATPAPEGADEPATADLTPGDPIEGARFVPVSIPATGGVAAPYVTLALEQPHEHEAGTDLWVELQVSRGIARWPLAGAKATDDDADLRWRAPNGATRSLSVPVEYGAAFAAMRVVGEADANQPIDALTVIIDGADGAVGFSPVPGGASVRITLGTPIGPGDQPDGAPGTLRLVGVAASPATYSFADITVVYADPIDGTS